MTVTGERVTTAAGGFNPTYQRHVAAYEQCSRFLPEGTILDIGAGIGHSFERLHPRRTIGVDIDPDALAGQPRETRVADMRDLPFADGEFDGAIAVHSIEHVPDPERALAECARVVKPGGTAVYVTPNRLTFARADEVIDPYHYREFDPGELRAVCAPHFARVEIHGIFGSDAYLRLIGRERARLDRLLAADPLRLRRLVPRRARQVLYDRMLTRARLTEDPEAAAIREEDFDLRAEGLERCLDVVAVCTT